MVNKKETLTLIIFFCNGQKYSTLNDITLFELLQYFNYNLDILVLEYNSFIYHKKYWKDIKIRNNDQIEIISIVGGG